MKHKNITRFDIEKSGKAGQHGWWVRLQKDRKKFHNFFNDSKFGGREEALKAAIMYRDIVKEQLANTHPKGRKPRSNSGITGISLSDGPYKSKGHIYTRRVWHANWTDETGAPRGTSFSVEKYGEEEAFRRALEARENGIKHRAITSSCYFKSPNNVKQKIWRYMDFTKFVSLIETGCLYFSNIESLNDPFEGSFSKVNEAFRPLIHKSDELTPDMITEKVKELRRSVFVNCWHMNDFESAAMWELYSKSNEAVCIQSDFESYRIQMPEHVDVGLIQYVNYEDYYILEHDPYLAFLYKRKSFEHESEMRGIVKGHSLSGGVNIQVDLNVLIHRVYVSPSAPAWLYNLVQRVVARYGFTFDVCQSSLSEEPFF